MEEELQDLKTDKEGLERVRILGFVPCQADIFEK